MVSADKHLSRWAEHFEELHIHVAHKDLPIDRGIQAPRFILGIGELFMLFIFASFGPIIKNFENL